MEKHGPWLPHGLSSCKPVNDDDPLNVLGSMLREDREAMNRFLELRHATLLGKIDTFFLSAGRLVTTEPTPNHRSSERADQSATVSRTASDGMSALSSYISVLNSSTRRKSDFGDKFSSPSIMRSVSSDDVDVKALQARSSKKSHLYHSGAGNSDGQAEKKPKKSTKGIIGRGSSRDKQRTVSRFWLLRCITRIAENIGFEVGFAILIVLNLFVMCVESQYLAFETGYKFGFPNRTRPADDIWPNADVVFKILDFAFGFAFTCEVLIKMAGLRCHFIWSWWNWFDTLIIASWLVHSLFESVFPVNPFVMRIARLARLIRILRLVRTLQVFDILHLMVASLRASLSVLLWSVIVLVGIMVSVALTMISLVEFYIQGESTPDDKRLQAYNYFGSFTKSFLSVFELTLGNWVPITRFLSENVSEWFGLAVMIYHCLVSFAVVMVIRGVFLHETFQVAGESDDLMILRQDRLKAKTIAKMEALFWEADQSGNGYLSREEFLQVMSHPRVNAWLAAMGFEVRDAEIIFEMMDDGDHQISAVEFVSGFTRLKGPARSMDMVQVLRLERAMKAILQDVCDQLGMARKVQAYML